MQTSNLHAAPAATSSKSYRSGGPCEPLLTHSVNWGYVWRVDYAIAGQPPDNEYVNRIVIWGKDASTTRATVAVVQRVPPLPLGNISGG